MFPALGLTESMAAPSAGTDRLDFCSPGITQAGAASRSTIHHQAGRDWEWDTLGALPWSSRDRIPAEQDFCTQTGFQREPHPSHGRLSSLDPPPEGLDPNKPHKEKPAAGKTPREGEWMGREPCWLGRRHFHIPGSFNSQSSSPSPAPCFLFLF